MNISSCKTLEFECYALAPETSSVLTIIGFIITILGFFIAIYQILKIRRNTEIVENTVQKLSNYVNGTKIAYLNAQMETFTHLVQSNRYEHAQIIFNPLKRTIRLHAIQACEDKKDIEGIDRSIGKIEKQIEWGKIGSDKYDGTATNKLIDDILKQLTRWESITSEKNKQDIRNENA